MLNSHCEPNVKLKKLLIISNFVSYYMQMCSWTPDDIKNLREKFKTSRPKFGYLLGVSGNYIYLLEKGVKKPSRTLQLLLDYVAKDLERKSKRKEGK